LDELYFGLDVLAVGEAVVDFISHDFAISLRTAVRFSRYLGGQPANVAVYVAKLGGRSAVITKVGTDYFGEFVEDQLGATASRRRAFTARRGSRPRAPSSPGP
jgi:sugar/nucleoside kinase (ribokinase family)